MELAAGQIVHVRSRQYLVEEVVVPRGPDGGPEPAESPLVRLACLEDDAQGEPLEVLWNHEVDARIVDASAWGSVAQRGFDAPRLFSAYLHTLRWSCVTATDARRFQAPYRAGIEVKAYQLEPLRKALEMPRVNLFIADDVGLGKTIEAGLILREMLLRQKVRRTVVCCPPSVVRQWHDEMEQRFGLPFVIYDREWVAAQRRERGYGVNPWTTHHRFILSHALLRDETYAGPLRDWLGAFAGGSLLILDEAHNAAPASGGRYAVDSRLTRAVRDLAPRFEHRLFLSATPHNGHSNSFSALLEMLDPQRFCRGVPVHPKLRDVVMVRRLKADLREIGEEFPERQVVRVPIDGLDDDAPELVLSRLLQRYRRAREERLADASRSRQASAMLVVTSLQKRLLSSIEAFARTLAVHRQAVERTAGATTASATTAVTEVGSLGLLGEAPGADDDRAELPEDEVLAEEDAQMTAATRTGGDASDAELALLAEMAGIAEAARHRPDARFHHLVGWIREHLCPDLGQPAAAWQERRLLIFTEYADTKRWLAEQLAAAIAGSDDDRRRVLTFHGGMGEARREAIKAAFNAEPARHPLRILVATDAAREGVNLQNHCADLIHFDIPWNPSRLEQRNGRIDRKLQRQKVVRCYYYVLPQRAEDRVLDVLVDKTHRIRDELGSLSPVIERRIDRMLEGGIRHDHAADLESSLATVDGDGAHGRARLQVVNEELEENRQRHDRLVAQQERLQKMLKASRDAIGLDERHFRDALAAALELVGAGPSGLVPVAVADAARDPATARWRIPALDQRAGADPSWSLTLDSLRAPRKKGQKPWDWRREAPIRPVVFRDPGTLDGEVVHLHLEHRLVKRLLGRFLSQGFLHDELTRACVVRTDDPVPRVIVLGRLSLYGAGAARLHDEIVAVAAEWQDPSARGRGKLRPVGEADKGEALRLFEDALASPRLREVPDAARERLKRGAAADVKALRDHLERRAGVLAERAVKALARRGDKEAADMRAILEAQRERILAQQRKTAEDQRQLELFNHAEARQLAADQRHWTARLATLERELDDEPRRVRSTYDVQARRVEPVGLVYLWPVSS